MTYVGAVAPLTGAVAPVLSTATGALALLALASQGGPDAPKLREEAAGYVAKALDFCTQWHTNQCARSQLPLERLVLQYPEELPPDLLARLRVASRA